MDYWYDDMVICKFRNVFRVKIACNSIRTVSQAFVSSNKQAVYDGRVELDTHADTFVAGRNCLLMHFTERVCDVMPYSDEYEAKRVYLLYKLQQVTQPRMDRDPY